MIDLDKLKKKEKILTKLADLLASNFIWDSNKGIADMYKREIKSLLKEYYNLICKSEE